MITPDIRWQQRFVSYQKVLLQLQNAVDLSNDAPALMIATGLALRSFD